MGAELGSEGLALEEVQNHPKHLHARNQAEHLGSRSQPSSCGPIAAGTMMVITAFIYVGVSVGMGEWSAWGWLLIPLGLFGGLMVLGFSVASVSEDAAKNAVNEFDAGVVEGLAYADSRKTLESWQMSNPGPAPEPDGVDHVSAEYWICEWMQAMGAADAIVTQLSNDGGIDIQSEHYIAQVKHYEGSVPISHVRDFLGVVATDELGRSGLFFNAGVYPRTAGELLDRLDVAAFTYDVRTATVRAHNSAAEVALERGLNPDWHQP